MEHAVSARKRNPYYRAETYTAKNSIGHLIKQSHSLMLDWVEPAFANEGITFTQWKVLMNLREGMANTSRQLCATLRHDSGALTRVIDQLEARGYVERQRSREDRREVELHLTPAGRDAVEATMPLIVKLMNEALAEFEHAEIDEFLRLLRKLNTRLTQPVNQDDGG